MTSSFKKQTTTTTSKQSNYGQIDRQRPQLSNAVTRDTYISAARRKPVSVYSKVVVDIPRSSLHAIFEFACAETRDYLTMILVCKDWYNSLAHNIVTWRAIKMTAGRHNKHLKGVNVADLPVNQIKEVVKEGVVMDRIERVNVFMKKVNEMYAYNSMKMNVPNKIIEWLKLTLDVTVDKKVFVEGHKFHYNKMNYAGYMYTEIKKISKLRFDMFDTLKVLLSFKSSRLEDSVDFEYRISKDDILSSCTKTKLFNYYIEKNVCIVYFDGDHSILKCLFEVSVVHLILKFAELFKKTKTVLSKAISAGKAKTYETANERYNRTISYDTINDYLIEQTHFEVSISIHNGKERVFYFVNTTNRPTSCVIDNGSRAIHSKTGVYSDVRNDRSKSGKSEGVRFYFDRLGEPLDNEDVYLKLNNELGISEKIEDLIFCEVMVKDSEKVRFVDSGLRLFKRREETEDMDYSIRGKMLLTAEEPGAYSYRFEIHLNAYSPLLNVVDIILSSSYFLS